MIRGKTYQKESEDCLHIEISGMHIELRHIRLADSSYVPYSDNYKGSFIRAYEFIGVVYPITPTQKKIRRPS